MTRKKLEKKSKKETDYPPHHSKEPHEVKSREPESRPVYSTEPFWTNSPFSWEAWKTFNGPQRYNSVKHKEKMLKLYKKIQKWALQNKLDALFQMQQGSSKSMQYFLQYPSKGPINIIDHTYILIIHDKMRNTHRKMVIDVFKCLWSLTKSDSQSPACSETKNAGNPGNSLDDDGNQRYNSVKHKGKMLKLWKKIQKWALQNKLDALFQMQQGSSKSMQYFLQYPSKGPINIIDHTYILIIHDKMRNTHRKMVIDVFKCLWSLTKSDSQSPACSETKNAGNPGNSLDDDGNQRYNSVKHKGKMLKLWKKIQKWALQNKLDALFQMQQGSSKSMQYFLQYPSKDPINIIDHTNILIIHDKMRNTHQKTVNQVIK
jgi:hypothetical protein